MVSFGFLLVDHAVVSCYVGYCVIGTLCLLVLCLECLGDCLLGVNLVFSDVSCGC